MEWLIEYKEILLFSLIPFLGTIALSWWLAPVGGILAVRNEIFSTIALPSLAYGIASILSLILPSSYEEGIILIGITMAFMFIVELFIPELNKKVPNSELLYGGLFIFGNTTVLLTSVIAPGTSHIKNLFNGEILSFSNVELGAIFLLFLISWTFFYHFRGYFFHFILKGRDVRFSNSLAYQTVFFFISFTKISSITIAAILCGPLLTSAPFNNSCLVRNHHRWNRKVFT